ncbi:hypothetical protein L7F22_051767, partial [Adiantum nelumboides]|nr:hypothetical protein [Adiantum nelumboides]
RLKTLSALGDIIHALASKNSHIPYRGSIVAGGSLRRARGIELGVAQKQLGPVELLKYEEIIEETREDGLRKDVIIVELQAAAKVREQTCKAFAVKVKENEACLQMRKRLE